MNLQVAVVRTEYSTSINFRVFEFYEDFHSQVFNFAIFYNGERREIKYQY